MKYQSIYCGENKKTDSNFCLLKHLPSMTSVNEIIVLMIV